MRLFSKKRSERLTNAVREARADEDVSLHELAGYCQVTPETIEAIERAEYEPSVVLAEHIARRLGKPVEELFFAAEPRDPTSPTDEERLADIAHRRVYNMFLAALLLALLTAFVLQFFPGYGRLKYAMFAVWALGAIAFLWGSTITGSVELNRQIARRKGKKQAIRDSVFNGLWFGMMMVAVSFFGDEHRSPAALAIQFLVSGILYGFLMHVYNYGWRWKEK